MIETKFNPTNPASCDLSAPPEQGLPTPGAIVAHLNETVTGQIHTKKVLANALYSHFIGKRAGIKTPTNRNVCFIAGPSGSGKTLMVKTAAEKMGVPFISFSATELVPAGIVGKQTSDILDELHRKVARNTEKANNAIIFIDECDKLSTEGNWGGQASANSLLTFLEGNIIHFPQPRNGEMGNQYSMDTSNLMIVLGGVCGDLKETVRKRLNFGLSGVGFRAMAHTDWSDEQIAAQILPEDVLKCGLSRELIGRVAYFSLNLPLNHRNMTSILSDSKISPLVEAREYFELHNIRLEVEDEASLWMAEKALELGTGARALSNIVNRVLLDAKFEAPDWSGNEGVLHVSRQALEDSLPLQIQEAAPQSQTRSFLFSIKKNIPKTKSPNKAAELREMTIPSADTMEVRSDGVRHSILDVPPIEDKYSDSFGRWVGSHPDKVGTALQAMLERLDWDNTTGSARKWWTAFEAENRARLNLVLRLAWELARRNATVTEFFLAYVYSNTDNIQANLHYLDYTRLKKEEERKRREAARSVESQQPSDEDDDTEVAVAA